MTETREPAVEQLIQDGSRAAAKKILAGVDRVELDEFKRIVDAAGEQFLASVYTPGELNYCNNRIEKLATRFAAKEAATKALGTGIRGVGLQEIEVVTSRAGQPQLRLHDRARSRADDLGIMSIAVSLSHTSVAAEAFVVALADHSTTRPTSREENLP